jgi:protein SCO1/2
MATLNTPRPRQLPAPVPFDGPGGLSTGGDPGGGGGAARRRPLLSAALAALVSVAASFSNTGCSLSVRSRVKGAGIEYHGGVLTPEVVLPDLALQRATGGDRRTADTHGRLALVFFGYTRCPDVCPLTLANVTRTRRLLGPAAASLDAYFVTVDPERDTPARLREYLANFDPAIVGLTGTPEALQQVRTVFGVVAEKRVLPGSAADYAIDHTALIYLVDGRGTSNRVRLVYPHVTQPEDVAADVRRLLAPA